jgi:hypothetical protein
MDGARGSQRRSGGGSGAHHELRTDAIDSSTRLFDAAASTVEPIV